MIGWLVSLANEIWGLFLEMAPYLLLGLTVAGILSVVVKREFVAKHIGRPGVGSAVKASLLGVPLPLCSCGVVPTASYLRRAGASRPALMSFLISTPQTGVDSIAATYGMLGPIFAVFRPVIALVTGIAGGVVSWLFGEKRPRKGEPAPHDRDEAKAVQGETSAQPTSLKERIRAFARYSYVEAVDDIALQFVVGLVIAGLISLLIPDDFFADRVIGSGLPAMLLMVAVGIPMYVCSTSSIPIAVALIAKGISPGAAYVFLVAGPATNAATLAVLSRVLGKRQTILYVATLIVGSLAFGPLMDLIASSVGWSLPVPALHQSHGETVGFWPYFLAGVLGMLLLVALARRWWPRISGRSGSGGSVPSGEEGSARGISSLTVQGMTCNHCAATVEDAARSVSGVTSARVDLRTKNLSVEGSVSREDLAEAVRRAGYQPVPDGG
jgi:uncharacterized membrane protein YraQ (UPF0718 family)/copper chaperone CopZ